MTPRKCWEALVEAAFSAATIAVALAGSGLIVGVLTRTGAALAFGGVVVQAAQGVLILAMLLTFVVVSILGTGIPTTAACPAFAYTPQKSAHVVELLVAAGAIPLGKTNLDQFATGLVGVRSPEPWGPCQNAFNADYISGGSSSGSALAVAKGWASFALGTDTAGSGRVPAALNNIVGLKPSKGLLSTQGLVPACRSLDCISIFALTCADANRVLMGPPGIGKTRLSLEAAKASIRDFADGVFFVPLAPLDDPDLVAPAIAQTLAFIEMFSTVHEPGSLAAGREMQAERQASASRHA